MKFSRLQGNRLRQFTLMLLLSRLGGTRLIGASGLAESVAIALASSHIGVWLDRHQHERRWAASALIYANGFGAALLSSLLAAMLTVEPTLAPAEAPDPPFPYRVAWMALLAVAEALNAALRCVVTAFNYVYTTDWLLVLTERERDGMIERSLAARNSAMTIIDQLVGIVTPLAGGVLMSQVDYRLACIALAAVFLCELCVERYVFRRLGNAVAELRGAGPTPTAGGNNRHNRGKTGGSRLFSGIAVYFRQQCLYAALAIALLRAGVLRMSGASVSYAKESGVRDDRIGLLTSGGNALGFVAAISYPFMVALAGVATTALVGIGVSFSGSRLVGSWFHLFLLSYIVNSGILLLPRVMCRLDLGPGQYHKPFFHVT